jgi:hypothetical protein
MVPRGPLLVGSAARRGDRHGRFFRLYLHVFARIPKLVALGNQRGTNASQFGLFKRGCEQDGVAA